MDDLLSPRELDVLLLVAEGFINKEIGAQLHIEEATVKFHLQNIFPKLGATNRREAVRLARGKGWLKTPLPFVAPHEELSTTTQVETREHSKRRYSEPDRPLLLHANTFLQKLPTDVIDDFAEVEGLSLWLTLTLRERQIALLISDQAYADYSARALAKKLHIAETTVKKHLQHIYRKLKVSTRAGAALAIGDLLLTLGHLRLMLR